MADERETPPRGATALLKQYFGPLLAGLLTLRIVAFYALAGLFIPQASDITFPEGALVARAMDVAQGATPYHDWRQWPHAFAPYPPLAYYPVGWLAGPEAAPHEVYMIGRACSFVMLIGIFVALYLLGRRLGLSPAWSLAGVALLGEFRPLLEYCASYRPDAAKTFFALLALLIADCGLRNAEFSRERGRPRPLHLPPSNAECGLRNAEKRQRSGFAWWLVASLACLLLSAWFKPTAWGIGALILFSVWRRLGLKRGALVTGAFLAAGILPLLYLNHHWHGLLLLNIVDSLRNGFSLEGLQRAGLRSNIGPAVVALVGCGCALAGLRRGPAGRRLILAAAPLSVAASLFQMLKAGSDVNYFMDSYPLAALAATWGVARLWRGGWRLPEPARAALLGCALTLPLISAALDLAELRGDFQRVMLFWREPVIERIVRAIPGPVLATNPFLALTHPEDPGILDYYQYSILCRRGAIDPEPLLHRVREGAFNAIVISDPVRHLSETRSADNSELYCRGFLPALERYYRRERQVGIYAIYTPLPRVQRAGL